MDFCKNCDNFLYIKEDPEQRKTLALAFRQDPKGAPQEQSPVETTALLHRESQQGFWHQATVRKVSAENHKERIRKNEKQHDLQTP